MATPRTPNQRKQYAKLNARLAKYGKLIERLYDKFNREAANIAMRTNYTSDSGKMFRFRDYPQTREALKVLLSEYVSDLTGTINSTTSEEWQNSNDFQDLVANKVLRVYGVTAKDGKEYQRYYQVNSDHLKAFQTRTVNGMNLSRRVWNMKEQYQQELEMGLSVSIEKGTSAAELAKELKQYLKNPDKLFRRVRNKFGNLKLSQNAKAYHPGSGVYRSSYKNALRLTRSEANMAYRTAEQTRWRQFDFVVGYEIKLSKSHPCHDVCDTLAGKYPKTFRWTGWHPMDMCYCVSILKTDDEFWSDSPESRNEVKDVPQGFRDWIKDNAERIEKAEKRGTQPYFIVDNKKVVEGILKPSEPKKTALEVAKERHAARTQEDITDIKTRWEQRIEQLETQSTLNEVAEKAASWGVTYNNVLRLTQKLKEDEIITKIGGGDKTAGSCSSLAFTYAANRVGFDVRDFRGGDSQRYFAQSGNIMDIASKAGGVVAKHTNDFTKAKQLLSHVVEDREYYFTCGKHAAVVRRNQSGQFEYLELQSQSDNGWKLLNSTALKKRFAAKISHTLYRMKYETSDCLIDIELFRKNYGFRKMLGFINTNETGQKKGFGGTKK